MKLNNLIFTICLSAPLVVLSGCGSSSNSSSNDTNIQTGRLIDSAVEGLAYRTETRTGVTNENGEFTYLTGENIIFGLGDLEFPAVTAAQILTPLELAGVEDINDTGVVNMARLLQSLDKDCDPSNGITIDGEAVLSAAGMSIDFESPDFDEDVVNLVSNGGQDDACQELVDAEDAVAHFQETLDNLNNQPEPPISGGLLGKVGVWEGVGLQDELSWSIRVDIKEDEQLIEYPSLNCGGSLELLEETDAQLLFKETIHVGGGVSGCVDQGFVELTDQSENQLVYRYYWPSGGDEVGSLGAVGTLTKVE